MAIKKFVLGPFSVNCYVLTYQGECFLVDPGEYSEEVKLLMSEYIYKGILLTHGHLDHINSIDKYEGPIYIHQNDYDNLFDDSLSGYKFFSQKKEFNAKNLNIIKITENDKIPLGDSFIEVIHTPGHTKGSVCYLFNDSLLSGDTLFNDGIGRTDLPGGNEKNMKISIVKLIDSLKDYVKVYPGHGEKTTIRYERINNYYYINYKKSMK